MIGFTSETVAPLSTPKKLVVSDVYSVAPKSTSNSKSTSKSLKFEVLLYVAMTSKSEVILPKGLSQPSKS